MQGPLSYLSSRLDFISLPRVPVGIPSESWETGGNLCPLPTLNFSISLLGKPPHSSIMSMATGKNLQSIPKKVSKADPDHRASLRGHALGLGVGLTWKILQRSAI